MKTALITVHPGDKIRLKDVNPDATGDYKNKDEAKARCKELDERIDELQETLYAENRQSLLIVFQAMDTGGKDGACKSLLIGTDPTGVRVTSFKAPTAEELAHDFLWRVHQHTPPKGYIGVWNRSHYEDVLIARVRTLVPKEVWKARYEQINQFEEVLAHNKTTILKFYLHISKDEQKKRLQSRLDRPHKNWKFNMGDLEERKKWDEYQAAYEDAIVKCATEAAPWHIVPANHKWGRDVAVAEHVVKMLEKMNPQFPQVDFDPKTIVID